VSPITDHYLENMPGPTSDRLGSVIVKRGKPLPSLSLVNKIGITDQTKQTMRG